MRRYSVLSIMLGMCVILGISTGGLFLRPANVVNVLLQSSTRGIVTVGVALVIISGGIDLSVGGQAVFIGCMGGWLLRYGMSPWLVIPLMLLVGCVVGAANGAAVARLSMAPFIVTLATWQIMAGLAYQFTGGGQTIFGFPNEMAFFAHTRVLGVPMAVLVFVLVALAGYIFLERTELGRKVYAVGGNKAVAWLVGVDVFGVTMLCYILSGLLAGLAAVILISRIMCANITIASGLELDAIAAAVIGGISLFGGHGKIGNAVIGALMIGIVNNGLNLLGVNPYIQGVVKGGIIFLAVMIDALRRRRTTEGEITSEG